VTLRLRDSVRWLAMAAAVLPAAKTGAQAVNPWVTSDAVVSAGMPMPNTFSLEAFHNSPMFKGLAPRQFCLKLFDIYYDGRRKSWADFKKGLTLWAHTPQEPRASANVIELDPIVLLNVHGSGYCGIQSGLLEGIYQSRPGGTPGKPAIDARRWFLAGIIHSVTDAFYEGRWHYLDIDLGGWAGDEEKGIWSVADVMADPKGYYGSKTTIKSKYFFRADGDGKWVEKINPKGSYTFQDNEMLGHEMTFVLRRRERFTRYFSRADAGWSETLPHTRNLQLEQKGFCELVYAPDAAGQDRDALWAEGDGRIFAVRCPYTITSSRVEAEGKALVSFDLGRTWRPVAPDGSVPGAANRWDYLLKVVGGRLKKVTTRGVLHPGALPRVGPGPTTMTVRRIAEYQTLTWIPDFSSESALRKQARITGELRYLPNKALSFTGGRLQGRGTVTFPVAAPKGTRIVKLAACVLGGASTTPSPQRYLELYIGPAGRTRLVGRSTDCSTWGTKPATKVNHWQINVNGQARFAPASRAEVAVKVHGSGVITGVRIFVGYVPERKAEPIGTLTITHGFDGRKFSRSVPVGKLGDGFSYTIPDGAKRNEYIRMEVR